MKEKKELTPEEKTNKLIETISNTFFSIGLVELVIFVPIYLLGLAIDGAAIHIFRWLFIIPIIYIVFGILIPKIKTELMWVFALILAVLAIIGGLFLIKFYIGILPFAFGILIIHHLSKKEVKGCFFQTTKNKK